MGDGGAGDLFARSFIRPVEEWRDRLTAKLDQAHRDSSPEPVVLARAASLMTCALSGETSDIS
eukprot:9331250-Pyramimonas_sp.AAC.1